MPGKRFTSEQLYRVRNHIPIDSLIEQLSVPYKISDGIFRFLCPLCNEGHTATHPETNLARCFDCQTNFNTIDLTMRCRKTGFVDSVKALIHFDAVGTLP